ncbi:MAG: hypothetical protein RLN62_03750 [Rickettsiales bacterium]
MKKILIGFLFLVSSCTFTPINQVLGNEDYNDVLASVELGKIDSKYPYILKNYLIHQFNPQNLDAEKKYILNVKTTASIEDMLVQQDSTVTVKVVRMSTDYSIKNKSTNKIIAQGSFPTSVSYAETSSHYSSYVNEEYSYKNGLKEVSRNLKLQTLILISKDTVSENISKRSK